MPFKYTALIHFMLYKYERQQSLFILVTQKPRLVTFKFIQISTFPDRKMIAGQMGFCTEG